MNVRTKVALTIFITGLFTAVGVVLAVLLAYQRFEHEAAYYRADAFLRRVVTQHTDLMRMWERFGEDFTGFLGNLVLYDPDTQLYLLAPDGTVLSSTIAKALPPGYKVRMGPVLEAAGDAPMPYVLGDDPERMDTAVVVAARPLRRQSIQPNGPVDGYLYLVCRPREFSEDRWTALRNTLSQPALLLMLAVVALATLLAAWVTAAVTRPLARLTHSVGAITRDALKGGPDGLPDPVSPALALEQHGQDEFGQLARGIRAMLDTLHQQWATLRRLDHFRREGVSNLSHDLRSPLTATTACLETLDNRWRDDPARSDDRQLLSVAMRNTHNAARLVQSLGDLARLDEPTFELHTEVMDARELIDDLSMRFAQRAQQLGIGLETPSGAGQPPALVALDIELIERALANLLDNALKFCPPGATVSLSASVESGEAGRRVAIRVRDTGPGIAAADLPHLFNRFYQSRSNVAPATGEGGKGLGLAIVKRIVELHGGTLEVRSESGAGTEVVMALPAAGAGTASAG